ncbi:unnamed protein product [Soboliphyme baturini]|uniref:WAP domain-containing protein n=1 Tax=Soboliphyme baturini TaxID=241478 RepID=A0A183J3H7_9BILA|nr:unnamed protein product [Soboliphyme baturini]
MIVLVRFVNSNHTAQCPDGRMPFRSCSSSSQCLPGHECIKKQCCKSLVSPDMPKSVNTSDLQNNTAEETASTEILNRLRSLLGETATNQPSNTIADGISEDLRPNAVKATESSTMSVAGRNTEEKLNENPARTFGEEERKALYAIISQIFRGRVTNDEMTTGN